MNPHEALEFVKKKKIPIVDLKFIDLLGTWQHLFIPVEDLREPAFKCPAPEDEGSLLTNRVACVLTIG